MRAKTSLLATLLALGVFTGPLAADAQTVQPGWVMPAQERGHDRQEVRPVREVLDMLRDRFGGEYVGHRLEGGPRPVYVIRWRMPDGVTTRDFRVDAATGQMR